MRSWVVGLGVVLAPELARACSGPGAAAAIAHAEQAGWLYFAVAILLTVLAALLVLRRKHRPRSLWVPAIIVALHPGWWLSARGGDCGALRSLGGLVATVLVLLVCVVIVVRHRKAA